MQYTTVGPIDDTISEEHAAVHLHIPTSTAIDSSTDVVSTKDDNTQSDTGDISNSSSDGINADSEIETMNREMERYVSRSPPYNPAAGNQAPRTQCMGTKTASRPSPCTPKGRPPAVTSVVGTTAQPKRKS
ncbi:hypothetical protein EI94DRAFT_1237420 [Lactarius quietus]|nr:hypothetical protein EI94DRAFT_1237420 [Lactarius quietus]